MVILFSIIFLLIFIYLFKEFRLLTKEIYYITVIKSDYYGKIEQTGSNCCSKQTSKRT